jgi:hypothetical protein
MGSRAGTQGLTLRVRSWWARRGCRPGPLTRRTGHAAAPSPREGTRPTDCPTAVSRFISLFGGFVSGSSVVGGGSGWIAMARLADALEPGLACVGTESAHGAAHPRPDGARRPMVDALMPRLGGPCRAHGVEEPRNPRDRQASPCPSAWIAAPQTPPRTRRAHHAEESVLATRGPCLIQQPRYGRNRSLPKGRRHFPCQGD